jgi:recombination protein RecA
MAKKKTKQKKEQKTVDNQIKLSQSGDIEAIRAKLNTQYKANIAPEIKDQPVTIIPSGILSLDLAIGNCGFIAGRIMDIYGWEATGKTLLCLCIAGYIQRCMKIDSEGKQVNRVVALLDAEGTFNNQLGISVGLDTENLILVQSEPDKILSGEDYFDIMVTLIGMGVDYIIVDSCPALTPSTILINAMGQGQKATKAQLMAEGIEKITPLVNACGQTLIHFVNQIRGKPMDMYKSEQETGGNALKFYSSYRFQVVKSEDINKKVLGADGSYREKKVGVTSCVRIVKSKVAPIPPYIPSTTYHFEYDVYFESFKDETGTDYHRGIDVIKDYCETGIRTGVIVQAGAWFKYGDIKGQGRDDLYQKVRENPAVMANIRDEVFAKMGSLPTSSMESTLNDGEEGE